MNRKALTSIALFSLFFLLFVACPEKSPEQKVMELRAQYTAELNGFIAKAETPPLPEPMPEGVAEGDEMAADEASEGASEDAAIDEEDLPVGPLLSTVLLDIIVMHQANENLPGITLDVTQAGPEQEEKAHFRFWIDTSNLARGQQAQINHSLEGVDYVDGDGFFVEVRRPIPEGERGEYREFSQE